MDSRGLPSSPALRRTLFGVAALFGALVAARVHGFSLPLWHRLLDGSPAPEVLLGQPRKSRWDDVVVQLPLNLAQGAHRPRFPAVNTDVGLGQSMLVPAGPSNTSPTAHPIALFRPLLWGFFLGDDVGLAWMWWGRLLGLFAVALGLGFALSGSVAISAAVAAALVFQPGFQLLGLNGAPHAIFMGLAWLATRRILIETRTWAIGAAALGLGWAGACFALELYPPFQVGLAWLYAFLLAGLCAERGVREALRERRAARLAALGVAGLVALASVGAFAWQAWEPIERLRGTVYPGQRVSLGGALELPTLLSVNLLTSLRLEPTPDLVPYAVGFWLLSPLLCAMVAWQAVRRGGVRDPIALALALFCLALLAYALVGVPPALAQWTLLRFLPAERAWLPLGVADALLLVRVVSRAGGGAPPGAWLRRGALAAWLALICVAASDLRAADPREGLPWLALALALNGLLADGVLRRRHPAAVCAGLAAVLALCTAWFNPLVVGGSAYLRENPLSQRVLALDRERGGETVWASYGGIGLGNLFRVLGVRSVGGVHGIPQLELWRRIDPQQSHLSVYNRYAHVLFDLPGPGSQRFERVDNDAFVVRLAPEEPELERLGVTHLLVDARVEPLRARFERFAPLARVGRFWIFALPLAAARDGEAR